MKLPTFFARRRNLYWTISGLIIIILIALFSLGGSGESSYPLTVKREKFTHTVDITGKAVFDERADLGFDKNGRISALYKKVGDKVSRGDVIASIDNNDINAELAQKQATVDRERAKLDSTLEGTRPEQLAIYTQSFTDTSNALVVAMRSSYLKVESALLTQVDTVFTNGSTVNPQTTIVGLSDNDRKRSIEQERFNVSQSLNTWKTSITTLESTQSVATIDTARSTTSSTLRTVKSFMDTLSKAALDLNENNSAFTSDQVDEIRDTINSASQSITNASDAFVIAETAYNNAKDTLTLAESGSTAYDVSAQTASLRAAEADLASTRARFSQTIIVAPFEGIVTRMDAKLGEIVSPSESPVTVMNLDSLIIEAYVPEININQIMLGNRSVVTFDAFDDQQFEGSVTSIDLAETQRDGVATYKIQVTLDAPSSLIRSGMTADVNITTHEKDAVIVIPKGYLIKEDGRTYVMVGTNGSAEKVEIKAADIGSMSMIEVIQGLDDGDQIMPPSVTSH